MLNPQDTLSQGIVGVRGLRCELLGSIRVVVGQTQAPLTTLHYGVLLGMRGYFWVLGG